MWEFGEVKASRGYDRVVDDLTKMPGAKWFKGARLNFAENLLRYRDDRPALIFKGEDQRIEKNHLCPVVLYKWPHWPSPLKPWGSIRRPGGRFMPNMSETIMAMLAATSLGAVWSSCSPDFGIKGRPGPFRPDQAQRSSLPPTAIPITARLLIPSDASPISSRNCLPFKRWWSSLIPRKNRTSAPFPGPSTFRTFWPRRPI